MARYHVWKFLRDRDGSAVAAADISIYLAGSNIPAYVYLNEVGGEYIGNAPQVRTNSAGFFEFWIGDDNEAYGYNTTQKFKIAWERVGVSTGYIDYVEAFASAIPVDESSDDATRNKTISNTLAKQWTSHVNDISHLIHGIEEVELNSADATINKLVSNAIIKNIIDNNNILAERVDNNYDFLQNEINNAVSFNFITGTIPLSGQANGIARINTTESDSVINKLVSNSLGKQWSDHTYFDFSTHTLGTSATNAHGLDLVNPDSLSTTPNKLVSNKIIHDLKYNQNSYSAYTITNISSTYTIPVSAAGGIINFTNNSNVANLLGAAAVGAGYHCYIWNTAANPTHTVTITPNGSDKIDGKTTLVLYNGEGLEIISNGINGWDIGNKKTTRSYVENIANNAIHSIAIGSNSIAIGISATSTGNNSLSIGSSTSAGANYSIALGTGSTGDGAVTATGAGAIAIGNAYASGVDSLASNITNNTSTYGAQGANSIAVGQLCKTTATNSIAIGANNLASANGAIALGINAIASGVNSTALGSYSNSNIYGKLSTASGMFASSGDAQSGKIILRGSTTTATPLVITSDGAAASTTNQIILPNDSTFTFSILVVARRSDSNDESAGYKFEGVIDRNATAGSTAFVGTVSKTVLAEDSIAWDCNVTADTTNGGLAITVTGEAAKTIKWVATAWTSEVTG